MSALKTDHSFWLRFLENIIGEDFKQELKYKKSKNPLLNGEDFYL